MQLLKLFKSQYLNEQLATQATKNLLFILKKSSESLEIANLLLKQATNMGKRKLTGKESEKQTVQYILKLIGGTVLSLDPAVLQVELQSSLSLVYRIVTNEHFKGSEMAKLSNDIMNLISNKVGVENYTKALNSLKTEIESNRLERKRKNKEIKLTNPKVAIKIKNKEKERDKERKRKKNQEWATKRTGIGLSETIVTRKKSKKE